MTVTYILTSAVGSRVVNGEMKAIFFAQPPEALKGLLCEKNTRFKSGESCSYSCW